MLQVRTCASVHCDQCGHVVGLPAYPVHFRTENAAINAATAERWRIGSDGQWWCSACAPALICHVPQRRTQRLPDRAADPAGDADGRGSEWAAIFMVAAAEALTTAGQAKHAIAQARQALAVCRATRSTRLARALRHAHMRDTWPTHAAIRELGDEIRSLSDIWRV
jgi:hypothetical protein